MTGFLLIFYVKEKVNLPPLFLLMKFKKMMINIYCHTTLFQLEIKEITPG